MKFDTPHDLAEHLYNRTVEPGDTAEERVRIAVLSTRFAFQKFAEQNDE